MRRTLLTLLTLGLSVGAVQAQTLVERPLKIERYTLAANFDLDGEAADDDQVVTSANLVDATTFAIAAQPDSCRLIDMTVTDANSSITAGTVTVTGTDCLGYARVCAFDFAVVATRGTGVKTIPVTTGPPGSSCYLANVASVVSSALTGEDAPGTDLVKVGYTSNSVNGWPVFGTLAPVGAMGGHAVDITKSTRVAAVVTTSGVSSTTLTSVGNLNSFAGVGIGDLLQFQYQGTYYERKVTAKATNNSLTINSPLTLPTVGIPFNYKTAFFTTDPTDQVWVNVAGYRSAAFEWGIAANADTGGVVTLLECLPAKSPGFPSSNWVTIGTTTTATGSTQAPTTGPSATQPYIVDLQLAPFSYCRFGMKFGTGDDADGAPEDISVSVMLNK